VAFPDEPIGLQRIPPGWTAPPIGDVERDGVAENIVLRVICGNVLPCPADHCAKLYLPIRAVAAVWNYYRITVADDGTPARFEEQVWHAAILATLPPGRRSLLLGAPFVNMAVKVDRRVEYFARIHNRRERAELFDVVHVIRPILLNSFAGNQVVDDLIQAALQAVLIPLDELQHIFRRRYFGVDRIPLKCEVCCLDVDNEAVAQNDADTRNAANLEGSDLERFGTLSRLPSLRQT
jgi:hypothetical protein